MASIRDKSSPLTTNPDLLRNIDKIPEITTEEVLRAAGKISENKTPGLEGILNTALSVTVKTAPDWVAQIFKPCFKEGIFPKN